jgi:uncharacterized radical SAM superfamily protein
MQINEGIVISGGSFNAGQVAVGRNSQAIQHTYDLTNRLVEAGKGEVAQAIHELLEAIETRSCQVLVADEAVQTVQQIAEEVQKEKPNKFTIKGMLTSLKETLGSVADIADKLHILQQAIALMMGLPAI